MAKSHATEEDCECGTIAVFPIDLESEKTLNPCSGFAQAEARCASSGGAEGYIGCRDWAL